jgi:hypothetical protein
MVDLVAVDLDVPNDLNVTVKRMVAIVRSPRAGFAAGVGNAKGRGNGLPAAGAAAGLGIARGAGNGLPATGTAAGMGIAMGHGSHL